jgi:site-specific recombinase XerD
VRLIPGPNHLTRAAHRAQSAHTIARADARALLTAFEAQLLREGRAQGTRARYRHVLAGFLRTLEQPATSLSAADIDRALNQWQDQFCTRYGRPPATASYRGQINALRAFYRYLDRLGLLVDEHGLPVANPLRSIGCPPAPQAENDWLRPHEDQALLSCPGSLQERFIIHLLRHSGLRVSEAAALTLADLDLSPGREGLLVRQSKTAAGRRTIPILPQLQPLLEEWLQQLHSLGLEQAATPLLATRHGSTIKHSFIWRIVKRVAERAGVRPTPCSCHTPGRQHQPGCPRNQNGHNRSQISAHTLRRTYASDLLNRGLRLGPLNARHLTPQFLVRNPYARGRRVLSRLVARCIIVLGSQEREIRYESGFARAGGTEHAQTKRYPRRADLLQLRAIGQERHRPLGLARRAAVIGTSFRLQDKPSDFIGMS